MMNKKESSRRGVIKYLFVLPAAITLSIAANSYASASSTVQKPEVFILHNGRMIPIADSRAAMKALRKAGLVDEKELDRPAAEQVSFKVVDTPQSFIMVEKPNTLKAAEQVKFTAVEKPNTLKSAERVKFTAVEKPHTFHPVSQMPTFQGGDIGEFRNWVCSQIKYPAEALDKGLEGVVTVSFAVETDGTLGNVKVERSPSDLLTKEALRIIKSAPKWEPANQNDQAVRMRQILHIPFTLK